MKFHVLTLPVALLVLACLILPASADPVSPPMHPASLRSDILYTGKGEFVQVMPMRPLTMNAHVEQFAYDPLGLEIAFAGSEVQGDQTVHFVKTVDVRTGHEMSRYALTAPTDDKRTSLSLLGWSVSGKYLLLERTSPDPEEPETSLFTFLHWDLSVNLPVPAFIDLESALPLDEQSPDLEGSAYCFPSPDCRWLLFTQSIHTHKSDGKPIDENAYLLYDPDRNTFCVLTLPPRTIFTSWSDKTHLGIWQGGDRKQIDVVTDQITPHPASSNVLTPAASRQYPDLTLDVEQRRLEDEQGTGGYLESYLVWIRRMPSSIKSLGAAVAGLIPNSRDPSNSDCKDPQAIWSPTGKQVAFIAHSDLYVTDLIKATGPMPNEKLALGLKLSCADEQALAMSDLKQIGLGIVQYSQDNDEKFPESDGFVKTIYPYIKSDVFEVDGHRFVYEQPADLSLAKMDSPADSELGYLDLPCARVVLMADGEVKALPPTPSLRADPPETGR